MPPKKPKPSIIKAMQSATTKKGPFKGAPSKPAPLQGDKAIIINPDLFGGT